MRLQYYGSRVDAHGTNCWELLYETQLEGGERLHYVPETAVKKYIYMRAS